MKLSVIIVSYNVKYYLRQCIESLRKALEGIDAEICVIDNHSKDGTVALMGRYCRGVRLIASNHNHGFARANNIAIRQTTGEYVLLLNPDTIVGENTIRQCLDFMDDHEKAGGVGVRMLKCDGSDAMESRRGLPTPMTSLYKMCGLCARYPKSRKFGKYYMGYLPWDKPARIEIISGAFMMMRRSALNKSGLLDEDFFMYGEDIDLSYRLLKSGYENWYVPARILHYKGESTQKSSFRYVHVFYDAMLIFFKKHYGHLSFWLNVPIKSAIYVKATFALVKMQSEQVRKSLGFSRIRRRKTPRYFFFGSRKSIWKCRKIAERNGLDAQFFAYDRKHPRPMHTDLSDLACENCVTYAVYDVDLYDYDEIFEAFSERPMQNVLIGTFDPKNGTIITDKEIIN